MTAELHARHPRARARSFEVLLEWALRSVAQALPENVVSRAALTVVDELAAILAAVDEPDLRAAQEAVLPAADAGSSTIVGRPLRRGSVRAAAVSNAMSLSWMELDEGYAKASCHAGLYILPTLWAHAETSGASVRTVLCRLAVGYEVMARLAAAYPAPRFSWHPHAMWSSVGAAVARSLAEECGFDTARRATRMAASLTMLGGYEAATDGAQVRNVWASIGVVNGFTAFDLAAANVDGPAGAPESVFARLTGREDSDDRIDLQGLGLQWALFDSFTKEYACCQSMHSAIEAALEIASQDGFRPAAVAAVEIETPRAEMDNASPHNRLAAQFSLPHAVAAALLWGRADSSCFSAAAIQNPDVSRIRNAVQLKPWRERLDTPNARPATVRAFLRNGDVASSTRLKSRPMSLQDRDAIIRAKLRGYSRPDFEHAEQTCARLLSGDPDALALPWKTFLARCLEPEEAGLEPESRRVDPAWR